MALLIFCQVGTLLLPELRATTVVAIWSPDRVIIAADSKKTRLDGAPAPDECKIKSVGPLHFVTAGLFEYKVTGFYAPDIVERAFGMVKSFNLFNISTKFGQLVAEDLLKAREKVNESLSRNPDFNNSQIILVGKDIALRAVYSETNVSQAIRTTSTNNVPVLSYAGEFTIVPDQKRSTTLLAIGIRDHILAYATDHPDWTAMEPIAAAKMFVQTEIDNHPAGVGPPIAVKTIENDGTSHWIQNGVCSDH